MLVGLQACGGGGGGSDSDPAPPRAGPSSAEVASAVMDWNAAIRTALDESTGFDAADEPKLYAHVAVAVHDALNSIDRRYERYDDNAPQGPGTADPRAAVAKAARDILVAFLPADGDIAVDDDYREAISAIDAGEARDDGIAVGAAAAARVLDSRGTDLSGSTPFAVTSSSQFRAPPPYGVSPGTQAQMHDDATQTAAYATDFNEVKCLGRAASVPIGSCTSSRTAEQTEVGHFWAEDSTIAWNRIARSIANAAAVDGWTAARAFALMHMALVDVGITNSQSKAFYDFWRPEDAIEAAATDGNDDTEPVAGWQPLRPTPATPDYPSAHAANGNAAQAVLAAVFGDAVAFSTTSTSFDDGTTVRPYASLSQAAAENAESRVFIGYHFRHATEAGAAQGTSVGNWVLNQTLRAVP